VSQPGGLSGKYLWANQRRTIRRRVVAQHGMTCWLCGLPIASMAEVTMDHVVPVKDGGRFVVGNLRPAHDACNKARGHGPVLPSNGEGK
jgi:5-methylcytosine-specific restriction endonuclease McrA